jgi:hypothetical protein
MEASDINSYFKSQYAFVLIKEEFSSGNTAKMYQFQNYERITKTGLHAEHLKNIVFEYLTLSPATC